MPVEFFRLFVTLTVLCCVLFVIFTTFRVFASEPHDRYRQLKACLLNPSTRQGVGVSVSWFFGVFFGVIWLAVGIYHVLFG